MHKSNDQTIKIQTLYYVCYYLWESEKYQKAWCVINNTIRPSDGKCMAYDSRCPRQKRIIGGCSGWCPDPVLPE